ncbi:39S ribosomal protein L4, mitochondrial isoform X2 [Hippoglossus hippoglossus]|uniref:39S ribosomal protein L4, mitochondrial isoform X2 n=1 Tax=Hippoglossus hippoglossus TaxID=8267 RepID=UPI00148CEB8E|nr:39S ribosomal protein L4, mitochondrial isoform X2 [Hippoglossus hippoglossus]
MFRLSLMVFTRGSAKRSALPPNLLLPSNLVDPARLKRAPPPADSSLPLLRRCDAAVPAHLSPVHTWVETLETQDGEPLGLAQLHPDVFAVAPRLDILHNVETWQRNFKRISHANTKVRSEVRGGGKKPWKQKGSGRARQGSIRSPLWRGGGVSHGPRGPTSYYYMLPMKVRVQGLKVALSSKMAQDYLHIVDSLNIPTPDSQYLLDLIRLRHWGESVLIVDVGEEIPQNILQATANLKTVNIIPAIGESQGFVVFILSLLYLQCPCQSHVFVSVRSERPQPVEARSRRPHSGNSEVPGGQAAVARPAVHASVLVQTPLLRLPIENKTCNIFTHCCFLCLYYISNMYKSHE